MPQKCSLGNQGKKGMGWQWGEKVNTQLKLTRKFHFSNSAKEWFKMSFFKISYLSHFAKKNLFLLKELREILSTNKQITLGLHRSLFSDLEDSVTFQSSSCCQGDKLCISGFRIKIPLTYSVIWWSGVLTLSGGWGWGDLEEFSAGQHLLYLLGIRPAWGFLKTLLPFPSSKAVGILYRLVHSETIKSQEAPRLTTTLKTAPIHKGGIRNILNKKGNWGTRQ